MPKKPENFCKIAVKGGERAIGRFVRSTAGRDCGRLLLVVGVEDENHLLLADGELRTLERPKKKKLRHVDVLPDGSQRLRDELLGGRPVLNAELRKIIAEYEAAAPGPDAPAEVCEAPAGSGINSKEELRV